MVAILSGIALHLVVGLEPVWWLAWVAPAPLLALALSLRNRPGAAYGLVALAALIGASVNLPYYTTVMPAAIAVAVTVAQASLWLLAVMWTRRMVLRHDGWWTVFAYPVIWTAIDTLMAALLPDGNWGNIGYSQYDFLPALQIASLFGIGGVTFVLSLVASALALMCTFGPRAPRSRMAAAAAGLVTAAALGYGVLRLQQPVEGVETVFGLAAIDDASGLQATATYSEPIWRRYEQHVEDLARQGATIIVLPEKVAVMSPSKAAEAQRRFAALAARLKVWIEIGVGIDDGGQRTNLAWLLSPQGTLARSYQKHHMAPPERDYRSGSDYSVQTVGGLNLALAICKDMHFASLGRAYGQRQAGVMLVPAWDFKADRFIATGMTNARAVENGYTVVRSAREGLMTVTDPYGRILAQRDSAFMPGSALLVRAKVGAPVATLYTRIGDALGWLCVAIAAIATVAMLAGGWRRRTAPTTTAPAESR